MGYNLKIGEGFLHSYADGSGYPYLRIDVKAEHHDDAPAYGEATDYTNRGWPSYSTWRGFVQFVGLEDMFFNEEYGLMNEHPGERILCTKHKELIDDAFKKYKKKYPNAVAGYSPKIDYENDIYDDPDWPDENVYLVRLEWLKYWVDWALDNCQMPIFKNT